MAAIGLVLLMGAGLGACSRSDNGASTATAAGFCRMVKQENARLADLSGSREGVARAAAGIEKLVRASPAETRDDVQLLSEAYQKVANGDFASLASKATKLQAAGKHVAQYTQDNCDFDLNGN